MSSGAAGAELQAASAGGDRRRDRRPDGAAARRRVVDVIAVRRRLVVATLAVLLARMTRGRLRVARGMGVVDGDHVLLDVVLVRVVKVPAVQIVEVTVVANRDMAAAITIDVRMRIFVNRVTYAAAVQAETAGPEAPDDKNHSRDPPTLRAAIDRATRR
jgi:hypothetical protein